MPEFSNARKCIGPKRPSFPGVGLCRQRGLSIVMLMKLLYTERERNYLSEQFQIVFKIQIPQGKVDTVKASLWQEDKAAHSLRVGGNLF